MFARRLPHRAVAALLEIPALDTELFDFGQSVEHLLKGFAEPAPACDVRD